MARKLLIDCGKCKQSKAEAEFPTLHGKRHGRTCKACMAANSRRHHADKQGDEQYARTRRNTLLQARYGITVEQEEAMLQDQHGRCAICATTLVRGKWHVDHCHASGKVRGLLCSNCNRGIGHLQEDVQIMRNAIKYVEQHGS